MRYLICEQQEEKGCDYTIGCGMCFYFTEAASVKEVMEKIIWPDGRDELSGLEGEDALNHILIVPAEHVVTVDVEALAKKVEGIRATERKKLEEKADRIELERLKSKYEA